MSNRVLVYVRTNNDRDRSLADTIRRKFEEFGIQHDVVDLCAKFSLYGHEFTYEAHFANDFSQIAGLTRPSLPLAVAGTQVLSGSQAILNSLGSLQADYGRT